MAAGCVLAVVAVLWGSERERPPADAIPALLPMPPAIARPAHLPAATLAPLAPLAERGLLAVQSVRLAVRVTAVDPALKPQLGLATYQRLTGSGQTWTPLTLATSHDREHELTVEVPRGQGLVVALASSPDSARHGYLAATTVAAIADTAVELRGDVVRVNFELYESPASDVGRGPWQLSRVDEPDWLPLELPTVGLMVRPDAAQSLLLGAGRYRLSDPFFNAFDQEFEVPQETTVVISPRLSAPRAARR